MLFLTQSATRLVENIEYAIVLLLFVLLWIYRHRLKKKHKAMKVSIIDPDSTLSVQETEQKMIRLAKQHQIKRKRRNSVIHYLNYYAYKNLRKVRKNLSEVSTDIISLIPAAKWLFDNFYVLLREIKRSSEKNITPHNLPILTSGRFKGYPRVYAIAYEMVVVSGGKLDEEKITMMLNSYCSINPLTSMEIWAFIDVLGLCLLQGVLRTSEDILHVTKIKTIADNFVHEHMDNTIDNKFDFSFNPNKKINQELINNNIFLSHVFYLLKKMSIDDRLINKYMNSWTNEKATVVNPANAFFKESRFEVNLETVIRFFIVSLRSINNINREDMFENISVVHKTLKTDPAGVYEKMNFETRNRYRQVIERLSIKTKISEWEIAQKAISLAKSMKNNDTIHVPLHVGTYLIHKGNKMLIEYIKGKGIKLSKYSNKSKKGLLYFGTIFLLSIGLIFLICYWSTWLGYDLLDYRAILFYIFSLFPIIGIAVELTNFAFMSFIPSKMLPSMDFEKTIPEESRTFVVMPIIVSNAEKAIQYVNRLEKYYWANKQENLYFALLIDFPDAQKRMMPQDEEILKAARDGIYRLNQKYPNKHLLFSIFIRYRKWNEAEGCFMGWERKRGKLEEFNALLCGDSNTSFELVKGAGDILGTFKYVITIDSDTDLVRGSAHKFIGIMSHPLNKPVIDTSNRIKEGYAIIQSEIRNHLVTLRNCIFSKTFAKQIGVNNYSTVISDVYQDAFDQGTFVGKGIYDLHVMNQLLRKTFPENSILSHDLLESCYVKCAFSSNVTLMDSYPSSVFSYIKREHRWIRGDWQLLPWLFKKTPIDYVGKWKIFDNLRRSTIPICFIIIILINAFYMPHLWYISVPIVFFCDVLHITRRIIKTFVQRLIDGRSKIVFKRFIKRLYKIIQQTIFYFILMPYRAAIALDAIARTLYRLIFTKRKLLQWQSAEWVDDHTNSSLFNYVISMWQVLISVIILAVLIYIGNMTVAIFIIYLLIGVSWLFSPFISFFISCNFERDQANKASSKDKVELRLIARRTWQYFKDYSTSDTNWLCPDNCQFAPIYKVTNKTSPTNIGLQLLSLLTAKDMGYVRLHRFIKDAENILNTIKQLPKWYGHLYNWYELNTLKTLVPNYISTVDSGNFVGYLITFKNGLSSIVEEPIFSKTSIQGIEDDIFISNIDFRLKDGYEVVEDFLVDIRVIAETIKTEKRNAWEDRKWIKRLGDDCEEILSEAKYFGLSQVAYEKQKSLSELAEEGFEVAKDIISRLEHMVKFIDSMVNSTDFTKLYDEKCRLFNIGYHTSSQTVDAGHYDLIASECSLTSFISIAKGDVPQNHWYKLARPLIMVSGTPVFVSWAGTMFEYLMPNLVMRHSPGSVFSHSAKFAVIAQQKYAKKMKIPWGISESQYFSFDMNSNYQYKAFGVPELQLQPRISNMLVVAPYASILAINLSTAKTIKNIKKLIELEAIGDYGFYEALDFSSPDTFRFKDYSIVQSFMAHHQGMTLVSLNNFLNQNIMCKRFHSEPMVKATEVLLEEMQESDVITTIEKNYNIENKLIKSSQEKSDNRSINSIAPPRITAHWLSNGYYSVLLTSDGDGFSQYEDIMVNRWRPDISSSAGNYIYLRDIDEKKYWSVAYKPTLVKPDEYKVVFSHNQVEYIRQDGDITTNTTVTLSAVHNYEIRNVTITNNGTKNRNIEVTSYIETVLDKYLDELYHPAFNKLFIESEYDTSHDMLLCKRRKHANMEKQPILMHMVKTNAKTLKSIEFETSRLAFIGRNNTVSCPDAILEGLPLSNKAKFSIDPILSLRQIVKVPQGRSVSLAFITGICFTKSEARMISEDLNDTLSINNVFGQFRLNSELELRYLNVTSQKVNAFQDLIAPIFYPEKSFRGPENMIAQNWKSQSLLWRFGVSGDNPILLLCAKSVEQLGIIKDVLKAYEYYQINKIDIDLIILIKGEEGYMQELSNILAEMTSALKAYDTNDTNPSLFILYEYQMSAAEINLLFTVARIVFNEKTGIYFRKSFDEIEKNQDRYLPIVKSYEPIERPYIPISNGLDKGKHLEFFNSFGGFTLDGREYEILLTPHNKTPMPWINVISNEKFGFHVSEMGAGYTWAVNSHENKITSWSNDPVTDPISEAVYIRDNNTGNICSPTALGRIEKGFYKVRHGFGYSIFEHDEMGIKQKMTMFASLDEPVRLWKLELESNESHEKDVSIVLYVEWVLGLDRALTAPYIVTGFDEKNDYLWSKCIYNYEFRNHNAFIFSSEEIVSYTGDRKEFLGINGLPKKPVGLKNTLSRRIGAGYDPCGAILVNVKLEPHVKKEIVFGLGQSSDDKELFKIINKYRSTSNANTLLSNIDTYWKGLLMQTQVKTENRALDIMTNGWLLYQTISCRLNARSAFYQCGGAYGYRDQLQDVLSLLDTDSDRVRSQIIIACSRQFEEGDVQHWWHPPQGLGVRTRISDDLLWLPYVTATYINHTGDYCILDEMVAGIDGPVLKDFENDIMFVPEVSKKKISVYEHCIKAIDHTRYGVYGLPLIGGGDWNDGMNMIGVKGHGESVWLGWFVYAVLKSFSPICKYKKDFEKYEKYNERAIELQQNIEKNAWDGEWYSRAYYDNGDKLGTKDNDECRIDSISQSWSVISGGASIARKYQALYSAKRFLVKPEESISLLLTPPFDKTKNNPGYIKDYYPGIRENGGQYTHAAVWLAIANAMVKDCETANSLLNMLNPINITATQKGAMRYEKEPYAVVADISMNEVFAGKGGWSWYTGSAGWLYQAYLRYFLGIQKQGDKMVINPATPPGFGDYQVIYKFGASVYTIDVKSGSKPDSTIDIIDLDGKRLDGDSFMLIDDGQRHQVVAASDYVEE